MLQRKDRSGMISDEFRNGVDDFIWITTRDPTIADVTGCNMKMILFFALILIMYVDKCSICDA